MPFKPAEVEASLQDKFEFSPASGHSSSHHWYELCLPGLPRILTMVSHSKKEIGAKIEGKMARQLRVRAPFFRDMIGCTKSCDDYYRQVREDPYPPFEIRL